MGEWLGGSFEAVTLAISPDQLAEVELRESIGLVAASTALMLSSLAGDPASSTHLTASRRFDLRPGLFARRSRAGAS